MKKISIDDFELDLVSTIKAPITVWGDSGKIVLSLHLEELDDEVYEEISKEEEMKMFIDTFNSYVDRMQEDAEYIENNKQKIINLLIKEHRYNNLEEYIKVNKKDCIKFEQIYYYIDDDCGDYRISLYIRAYGENIDNRLAVIKFDEFMNMTFDCFLGGKEIRGQANVQDFFEMNSNEFTIKKNVTDDDIKKIEEKFGYKLPQEYIDLIKIRNGGVPKKRYFPTEETTSWGKDYICLDAIYGIGDEDTEEFVIKEWNYPNAGIKGIAISPNISERNAVVIMNYSNYIGRDEPEIAYVDAEYQLESNLLVYPISLAKDFKSFVNGLVSEEEIRKLGLFNGDYCDAEKSKFRGIFKLFSKIKRIFSQHFFKK